MVEVQREIEKLRTLFPESNFVLDGQDASVLHILLKVNHIYNDFHVNEFFEIDIKLSLDYPYEVPVVFEVGGKIDEKYEHRYTNGKLCLGIESEIMLNCDGIVTLSYLIDSYVIPYFFSYRYYERYSEYPFGERAHASIGIIEAWLEIFEVETAKEVFDIINYSVLHTYHGHVPCPCNSGKKTRDCHRVSTKLLGKLNNKAVKKTLLKELKTIENEVAYYKQNSTKAE